MNPALWGGMTALGWGGADFIARFTGRALGPDLALFGMLGVGAVALTIFQWQWGGPLVWDAAGWWLLLGTGIGVAAATMLLYWGLARGPISVVAPIVGAYPVLSLALAVALGVTPSAIEWAAMAQVFRPRHQHTFTQYPLYTIQLHSHSPAARREYRANQCLTRPRIPGSPLPRYN